MTGIYPPPRGVRGRNRLLLSLDPDVVERTRMLLLDQVGISIRGRNDAGLSASMAAALRHLGLGSGNASVIGDGAAYSPPAAALFNGNLGHSLDFDDTHASGSIHPSAPIVPAALAAAEMVGAERPTPSWPRSSPGTRCRFV